MECIKCRICKSDKLTNVINLGEQYNTSRFPNYKDFCMSKTEIILCLCESCYLLQLRYSENQSELYEHEYGYRSGISNTMREHLKSYNDEILLKVDLNKGDTIVDIGSNDSTMLQYYSDKYRRIGVDPTGKQFKDYYINGVELLPTYFTRENFVNTYNNIKCKIVSSISMFYDLPDPVQFAKDIYSILDDDGIWTCEQSYLLSMIEKNSIDTICHEHLEYYSLYQIKMIADLADFKIIDIKFNECNGGSFRIYFAKRLSNKYVENKTLINSILENEDRNNLRSKDTYIKFMENCDSEIAKLKRFINLVNKNGKSVYIYGASTKGNCLLQYANITESDIKYAVERNLNKVGKMTSTGIPIISEEEMRKAPPEFLLVLPWHFRDEIIKRESTFLNNGGQFIFPLPNFEIYSSKKKMLITGCDGFIGNYIKNSDLFKYDLYGIGHNNYKYENGILKSYFDMNNTKLLENFLSIIKPDIIIHLASLSSSSHAFYNPIGTLYTNGMLVAHLCDIIHRNGWNTILFNAASSDMYKGHNSYSISENDTHKYHDHPYSIAKIMGSSIVDFYRKTYNYNFSNGIIFTTESKNKSDNFLLKKISNHIKNWKVGNRVPLEIGNIDSYRNIIHVLDVISAIHIIINQDVGDTYLICGDSFKQIKSCVEKMYRLADIELINGNNKYTEKKSGLEVLIIINNFIGIDINPTSINGDSLKLKKLGWMPKISIDDILYEYISD
jgi:GDP-mannose 4,6-dehydratase